MLDIQYIRDYPEEVKKSIVNRGMDPKELDVDRFLEIDRQYLKVLQEVESLRARRNKLADKIARGRTSALLSEAAEVKKRLQSKEPLLKDLEEQRQCIWGVIPNRTSPDMPVGREEEDNVEIAAWIPERGYLPDDKLGTCWKSAQYMPKMPAHSSDKDFKLKDHVELGQSLDIIDVEQSAKISGSRFTYLKREAVLLQSALAQFLSQRLLREGFIPFIPPLLVKERALYGTSHLPRGRDQIYKIESEFVENHNELYLVGSAEPSLLAYYADRVLDQGVLPLKMFALTTCFRSEVGSWGKDVRGIKRVHQFDKLEMVAVSAESQSEEMMEYFREINEWFLQQLGLPYRIVNKCTGDCGYPASYKQYDVDVWLPTQQEYMEVMTDTNTTDYQARRLNIKYRDKGGKLHYAHTINDTGCAMGRMIIAILDNYQQADGSVKIPSVLQSYTGFPVIQEKGKH